MKVAEKDGEKKTKNKKQQEKGRVLCRVDRVGRNKKKETIKRERIKEKKYPYVKSVFLILLGSLS